jgi:hypothetical protein
MKRYASPTLMSLIVLATLASTSPQAQGADLIEGWTANQTGRMQGPQKLEVCNYAARLSNVGTGRSYTLIEPFKEVLIVSTKNKKYARCNAKDFRNPFERASTIMGGGSYADVAFIRKGTGLYKDINIIEYQTSPEYTKTQISKFQKREVPSRAPASAICKMACDLVSSPAITKFLDNFYGLPLLPGVPVFMTFYDMDHDFKTYLTTGKLSKTTFKKSDFQLPKDYQEVKSFEQVFASENDKETLEMILPGR